MEFKDLSTKQKDEVSVPASKVISNAKELLKKSAEECMGGDFDTLTRSEKDRILSASTEVVFQQIIELIQSAQSETAIICISLGIDSDEIKSMLSQLEDGVLIAIKMFVLQQMMGLDINDDEGCDCETCENKEKCEQADNQNYKYN